MVLVGRREATPLRRCEYTFAILSGTDYFYIDTDDTKSSGLITPPMYRPGQTANHYRWLAGWTVVGEAAPTRTITPIAPRSP